jgi:hypothetical protein
MYTEKVTTAKTLKIKANDGKNYEHGMKMHLVRINATNGYELINAGHGQGEMFPQEWLFLPDLLLLASWKLNYETMTEFTKVHLDYLGPEAEDIFNYKPVEKFVVMGMVRQELEEAAATLEFLIFSSAAKENEMSLQGAVHRFLAYYGTQCAHVFQVGTGRFPLVERFFANLGMYYDCLLKKTSFPLPPNLKSFTCPMTLERKTNCAICNRHIPESATIFGIEYTYSKNDSCYPRVIYSSDTSSDTKKVANNTSSKKKEKIGGAACKPECMVKYLESVYPVLYKCISKMIKEGVIPANYHEQTNIYKANPSPFIARAMSTLMEEEKRLFFFVLHTFRREYDPSDSYLKINTPDVCDPRFPNADRFVTNDHKVVEGWQFGNAECAARIFGLADETIFYDARSEKTLTPHLIEYRKDLAIAVEKAGQEELEKPDRNEEFEFVWNHKWGIMYDHFENWIGLSLGFSDHLAKFQPFATEKPMLRYLKRCGLVGYDRTNLLIYPVRNEMFGFKEYKSGYKFFIDERSNGKKLIVSMLNKDVDCLLFARSFNFHTKFCFGGFIFLQDGQLVAVVIPNMFDYLTTHFSPLEFSKLFNEYAQKDFKLSKCQELQSMSTSELILKAHFEGRRAISFFLCLVLQRMSHEETEKADEDLDAPKIDLITIKKSVTIKNWRKQDCNLVKIIEVSDKKSESCIEMLEEVEQEALNRHIEVSLESKLFSEFHGQRKKQILDRNTRTEESKVKMLKKKMPIDSHFASRVTFTEKIVQTATVGSLATKHTTVTYRGNYWCRLILHNWYKDAKLFLCHTIPRDCDIFELLFDHFHVQENSFLFNPDKVFRFRLKKDNGLMEEITIPCAGVTPQTLAFDYGVSLDRLEMAFTEPVMSVQQKRDVFSNLQPLENFTLDRSALLPR